MNISEIKKICKTLGIVPTKKLGQNFLINPHIVEKILTAAELTKKDTVLEIGPGLGVLTLELVGRAGNVVAVEADKKLFKRVKEVKKVKRVKNLEIINEDILEFNFANYLQTKKLKSYKLISNLPYNITSPVLWKFLHEEKNKPTEMVVMVQKEVADRIISKPNKMSVLSVMCQFYTEIEKVCDVSHGNFWPEPDVDSSVIKLRVKSKEGKINEKDFIRIVKFGFAQKRKMLKNNLAGTLQIPQEKIISILKEIGLNEKIRAQELSVGDWIKLYKMINK